jgi:hypothetical protein
MACNLVTHVGKIGTATNPVPITLDDDLLSLADVRRLIAAVVFFFETAMFFTSSSNSDFSNVCITNLGQQGANEYIWICILGTEKLLRETRNLDTSKFEIRGVN